jgi:hypothetical protein
MKCGGLLKGERNDGIGIPCIFFSLESFEMASWILFLLDSFEIATVGNGRTLVHRVGVAGQTVNRAD